MPKPYKKLLDWLPLLLLATFFLAEQARILFQYSAQHTNLDQTLLWYAAKEFVHGRIHEPNFYGQTYFTTFGQVPGEVIHILFGTSLGLAMAMGNAILITSVWIVLAAVAYAIGKRRIALLALAIPVILRIQYLVFFNATGLMAGDCLAVIAVACALWLCKDSSLKLASIVAVGGLAVQWNYDTASIVVPLFLFVLWQEWPRLRERPRRALIFMTISAIAPIGWHIFQRAWYLSHPYDVTSPGIATTLNWSVFTHSISHIGSYFAFFAPAIIPIAGIAVVIVALIVAGVGLGAYRRKSYGLLITVVSFILVICFGLAVPHSLNATPDPGLYFAASRLFISLPMAIYVLLLLARLDKDKSKVTPKKTRKDKLSGYSVWCLVIFTAINFVVAQITFNNVITRATKQNVDTGTIDDISMVSACQGIFTAYKDTGSQLYATNNPVLAYGCAAEYNDLNTIAPASDRRGWLIKESYTKPIERMIVESSSCSPGLPKQDKCEYLNNYIIFIKTPPAPAERTLAAIGQPVKYPTN